MVLQEIHMASIPVTWAKFFTKCGYTRVVLDARWFARVGRYWGGMCALIRNNIPLSSVVKEYTDYGECISLCING